MLFLSIKDVDYGCIISGISKTEALNLMENIDLTEKKQNIKNLNIKIKFAAANLL